MSELKRSLGLVDCILMGVGVILGAGIYALVGEAAVLAGNAVWLAFLLAGLVAACTGLSYAELSSFIPKAGGSYYYANRAFGGHVAFLVSWLSILGMAIAASTVALGFAGYLRAMIGANVILTSSLLVAATTGLLIYGIEQSARVAAICTSLEVLGLLVVIVAGLPALGRCDYLDMTAGGASGIMAAGALVFFAYIGFEDIAQLAEETRDAGRNLPLAILLSIAVTAVLYVLVAIAAVSVIPWKELGSSESPLADVVAAAFGPGASLGLSIIALFSTANTVLILLMSAARLLYGMAEDGQMPPCLASIHASRQSPYLASLAVGAGSVVIIVVLKRLLIVANVANFTLLIAFSIINASAIVLRYREPETHRPFRIPGSVGRLPLIPLLGIFTSLFLLSYVGAPTIVFGLGLAASGAVFYIVRNMFRN